MIGKVDFRWSGQIMEPVDYMAFIGKNPGTERPEEANRQSRIRPARSLFDFA